jgi:hypothetical protein
LEQDQNIIDSQNFGNTQNIQIINSKDIFESQQKYDDFNYNGFLKDSVI